MHHIINRFMKKVSCYDFEASAGLLRRRKLVCLRPVEDMFWEGILSAESLHTDPYTSVGEMGLFLLVRVVIS